MWHGIVRRALWCIWAVSIATASAALDSAPDPPAISQSGVQSQCSGSADQIQPALPVCASAVYNLFQPPLTMMPPVLDGAGGAGRRLAPPMARLAGDPSPPIRA